MIVYDKAVWHIDGGEEASEVIERFKEILFFLNDNNMLSEDGVESLKYGIDSSISLNSSMVNVAGKAFLDSCYDIIIKQNPVEIKRNLQQVFKEFCGK